MPNTQQLKARIRSVKSTKQITKAMQMVAASKMRRAQDASRTTAPYTTAARGLLRYLSRQGATDDHPLFAQRTVKRRLIIVIAADKGLAGAYNSNVLKRYVQLLRDDDAAGIDNTTIAVGRKAAQFVARLKDTQVVGVYEDVPDRPTGPAFRAILDTAHDMFVSKRVDAVDVVFTRFYSSMTQHPDTIHLLPAGLDAEQLDAVDDDEVIPDDEALFEPSPQAVLDTIAARMVSARLYQALLDARASEHSQRMLAMKNATDNATSLVDDLTLEVNKQRQGAITQELTEISAGVEAMG